MSEKINSTQRALRILKALKGRTLTGLSNKELADRLNESPVNITRSLQALIAEGLVVKLEETGRFALS
ncbi:helix-turn-helix domain-containing protein, partial [Glaesserella parasuis]|nr:helix-turn-helix domain-containing protein [Glaesserella parasuis]